MPHFMIVLIPYFYLSNRFWIKQKCPFSRNVEPLKELSVAEKVAMDL